VLASRVVSRLATSIVFALACTTACKYEFVEGPNEAAEDEDSSEADSSEADSGDTKTTQDEMGMETGGDTGETAGGPICGDGVINGSEQCDSQDFSGRDCTNFGFMGGQLTCTEMCKVDTTMCE
jgi:hypothetical protein